jgi:hypothetical protein
LPSELEESSYRKLVDRLEGNNLLLNQGNGSFVDVAEEYGVRDGGYGWAALLEDFNNDGTLDLVQADEGRLAIARDERNVRPPRLWKGTENGFRSINSRAAGLVNSEERSIVAFDYNLDGSLDLATNDKRGPLHLYENIRGENSSLQVELTPDNHTDIGSEVTVRYGDKEATKDKTTNTDFMSQSTRVLHFGLGGTEKVDRIRIEWESGKVDTFENIEADTRLVISPDGIEESVSLNNSGGS